MIVPQKIYSPWRSPSKWHNSRPLTTSIQACYSSPQKFFPGLLIDITPKCYKYVIVPQKNFLVTLASRGSRQSALHAPPLIKLIIGIFISDRPLKKKIFSVTLASSKSGSRQSPRPLASIRSCHHKKCYKHVIVPSKIFSVTLASLKSGSRQSPRTLASIQVDNLLKKCYKYSRP